MTFDVHAIFGGTFNPPHLGHLEAITGAAEEFNLPKVNLMLSPQPPHKSVNDVTLQQRMDMLRLACKGYPKCEPDFTEIDLPPPSFTVNTLKFLRALYPNKSLVFFLGLDSLVKLHTWFNWQDLLVYAHIIVLPRPHCPSPENTDVCRWIESFTQTDSRLITNKQQGSLFFAETPLWDVSSTELRQNFYNTGELTNDQTQQLQSFLPATVLAYIVKHKLYKLTADNL